MDIVHDPIRRGGGRDVVRHGHTLGAERAHVQNGGRRDRPAVEGEYNRPPALWLGRDIRDGGQACDRHVIAVAGFITFYTCGVTDRLAAEDALFVPRGNDVSSAAVFGRRSGRRAQKRQSKAYGHKRGQVHRNTSIKASVISTNDQPNEGC